MAEEEIVRRPRRQRPYVQVSQRGVTLKQPRGLTRGSLKRRRKKNAHRRKRSFSGIRVNAATRTATVI